MINIIASLAVLTSEAQTIHHHPRIHEEPAIIYMDSAGSWALEIDGCEFYLIEIEHSVDCPKCAKQIGSRP